MEDASVSKSSKRAKFVEDIIGDSPDELKGGHPRYPALVQTLLPEFQLPHGFDFPIRRFRHRLALLSFALVMSVSSAGTGIM